MTVGLKPQYDTQLVDKGVKDHVQSYSIRECLHSAVCTSKYIKPSVVRPSELPSHKPSTTLRASISLRLRGSTKTHTPQKLKTVVCRTLPRVSSYKLEVRHNAFDQVTERTRRNSHKATRRP